MAHFAKINNEGIVVNVLVVPNEQEHRGNEYLSQDLGFDGNWIQCSYNTSEGVHRNGGTPLRGNYPSVGFFYDSIEDIFIPPKPLMHPSWVLSENKLKWIPPITKPEGQYYWNEETTSWIEATE